MGVGRIRLLGVLALVAMLSISSPRGCSPLTVGLFAAEDSAPASAAATETPASTEPAATETTATTSGITLSSALSALWTAANTEAGLGLIASIVAYLLARLWTAKPAWKALYDNYRGAIIEAVKFAEKEIPDATENKAAARLDAALKYLQKIDAKLATADQAALAQAVNVVHSEAETNENI